MRKLLAAFVFLVALAAQSVGLQHCATPTPPRGGPVDSIGPVLVAEESTPNFQTNFRPEEIRLTFDEWVELDPQQELIISPPLEFTGDNQPRLQRKSLVLSLRGLTLRDDVTYVVNIGAAIKDLNEGNPTENLRFVFATGAVLDTATVSGTIADAFTGEPLERAAVTLYSNLADTAVFTENPTYFAITDEAGNFTVSNVKPGDYRVVGLVRNPSARGFFADYSGVFPPTAVGFRDSLITVGDGANAIGTVLVSPVPIPARVTDTDVETYGLLKFALNQPAVNVDLRAGREYLRSDFNDTLRLYYRELAADTILFGRDSIFSDTVIISGEPTDLATLTPLMAVDRTRGKVNPGEGITLVFNRPVETLDTARVQLYRDTLPVPVPFSYAIDTLDPTQLRIRSGWQQADPYRLELLPGAVTDWYGRENADSIIRLVNVESTEAYGNLTLNLINLNGAVDYILRLVDEQGSVIIGTRRFIHDRFEYSAVYTSLRPGTYRMELIYDSNGNERYDAGDLRFGRQPEAVQRFEIEALRANWEVEKTVDLENN